MSPVNARKRTEQVARMLPEQLPSGAGKGQQLRALVEHLVADLPHGALLPSERELAERYRIARMTVRRELDRLTSDGLTYRVPGAGTFVADPPVALASTVSSFTEDMLRRGKTPGSRVLAQDVVRAGRAIGRLLEISERSKVVRLERVRTADDEPLALEESYIPRTRFTGLEHAELSSDSLFALLGERWHVVFAEAEQHVTAIVLAEREAGLLEVAIGTAGFRVRTVTRDTDGAVVQGGVSIYRGDRYEIELRQSRVEPV